MIGIDLLEVCRCVLLRRLCCRRPVVRQRDRVIAREREGEGEGEEAREGVSEQVSERMRERKT